MKRELETGSANQAGIALIEVMIVLTVMVPILTGIGVATASVTAAVDSNSRAAEVVAHCRRMGERIAKLVRPAKMSSLQAPATALDVTELRATTVGEWILPSDLVSRPGVEFTAATGLLSMNAALSTSPRRVEFVMDTAESDNGVDDDGDGLIDEGDVSLQQNGVTLAILRNVEECSFALDQRVLQMRLRIARRDDAGRVYRAAVTRDFYLRNN